MSILVRLSNPGTAFTTVPKPTAALVLIIAVIDPIAPLLIAFTKDLIFCMFNTMMRRIPEMSANPHDRSSCGSCREVFHRY